MSRVDGAASVYGARTYQASGLTKALANRGMTGHMMFENNMWLRWQMARGRTILDIGHGGIEAESAEGTAIETAGGALGDELTSPGARRLRAPGRLIR